MLPLVVTPPAQFSAKILPVIWPAARLSTIVLFCTTMLDTLSNIIAPRRLLEDFTPEVVLVQLLPSTVTFLLEQT